MPGLFGDLMGYLTRGSHDQNAATPEPSVELTIPLAVTMAAPSIANKWLQAARDSRSQPNASHLDRGEQLGVTQSMQVTKRQQSDTTEAPRVGVKIARVDRRSADERRLVGDYGSPADAISIGPPTAAPYAPPHYAPSAGTPRATMPRKLDFKTAHTIKPQNSLNREPHAANTTRLGGCQGFRQPPGRSLETQSTKGGNVGRAMTATGDDFPWNAFSKVPNTANKVARGKMASSSSVVADAERDSPSKGSSEEAMLTGKPIAKSHRRPSTGSQASVVVVSDLSNKNKRRLNPFGDSRSAFQSADAFLKPNKRRKNSQPQSQRPFPQSSPPLTRPGEPTDVARGTSNEPVEIAEDEPWTEGPRGASATRQGVDGHRPSGFMQYNNGRKRKPDEVARLSGASGGTLQRAHYITPHDEERTSKHFIEDPKPQAAKTKAKERMQADSRTNGGRGSLSSADELSGGTTVRKGMTEAQMGMNTPRRKPSPTEADLRPTHFYKSGRNIGDGPANAKPSAEVAQEDSNIIPIKAFFAAKFVADADNLRLLFDEKDNLVYLLEGNSFVRHHGKDKRVYIEAQGVREFWWSRQSNRTILKGAVTGISNGTMCIAVCDTNGRDWLMDRLVATTQDHTKIETVDTDHLNRKFTNLSDAFKKSYDRLPARAARDDGEVELEMMSKRAARQAVAQSADEERIQYEHVEEDGNPPFRKGALDTVPPNERRNRLGCRPVPDNSLQPRARDEQPRQSSRVAPRFPSPSPPPEPERWTEIHKPRPWQHPVVYPSEGPRRTTIDFGDLPRLDEGEFLNDNLISFALRRTEQELSPEQRGRIYFFNTFFYSSLSTSNGKRAFNYDAVKKWTKSTDLISTPYVVVPINHDLHWFVAIICNLDRLGPESTMSEVKKDDVSVKAKDDQTAMAGKSHEASADEKLDVVMDDLALSAGSNGKPENGQQNLIEELPDAAKADGWGDVNSRPSTATNRKTKKKGPPPLPKLDSRQPAIITLDSFGSAHTGEVRMLKDYVIEEAKDKKAITIDRDQLKGITAKGLPEQTNFCDCGVYLVGYIEQFAKDPDGFVKKVLSRELDKNSDFATFDPNAKRAELRDALLGLQSGQEAERKENKRVKTAAKIQGTVSSPAKEPGSKSGSPDRKAATKSTESQTPRLPAVSRESEKESLSPLKPPPPSSRTGAKSSAEAQMQEEFASAAPTSSVQVDGNQPGDTGPISTKADRAEALARAQISLQPSESFDEEEEMLDNPTSETVQRRNHVVNSETAHDESAKERSNNDSLLGPLEATIVKDSQE